MKILLACECSGRVRDAFIEKGHNAISCDIKNTERPGPHIKGFLEDAIGDGSEWDMIIAFPSCQYIAGSGLHWNKRTPGRAEKTTYALSFVAMILNRNCPKIVIENPVGCISTRIVLENGIYAVKDEPVKKGGLKPSQSIQPYQFGEDASKRTCLWIKGDLPLLKATSYFSPRITKDGKKRWGNQTDSGQNKLGPSETRAADRAVTYWGIAKAMANQWNF